MIVIIILGIITLGFTRLMLSQATQTTNNDLSQSAYDSALAGVEDAKISVIKYHQCLNKGYSISTGTEECKFLIKTMQEGIKKQIREKNVQYIQGDQELYRIELTERGQKMYNSILYLRPSYTAKALSSGGRVVYDFDCTREQIQNYFFRFGKDALILSPDSLREEFAVAYRRASRAYKTP